MLCHNRSFLWHALSFQSVYFGEIIRVMRHICIFLAIFVHHKFILMLGGCYCRLPDRIFIWLIVERVSI